MEVDFNNKTLMIKYLLKELSEVEAIEFEQGYFQDQELFEQLLFIEDELIDDYARGVLSKEVKERFEKYYLTTPKRHQRVIFAKILIEKVDSPELINATVSRTSIEEEKNFWQKTFELFYTNTFVLRWALITIGLVLSTIFLWVYIKRVDMTSKELEKKQLTPIKLGQKNKVEYTKEQPLKPEITQNLEAKEKSSQKIKLNQLALHNTVLGFTLYPSVRSAQSSKTMFISPEVKLVNIELNIDREAEYEQYSVVLIEVKTEKKILEQSLNITRKENGEKAILIQIPAKKFKSDDYVLTLSSISDEGEYAQNYNFSVKK